ncbi:MAG: YdjY domain-containing protein [Phycisphaeraceae bacterium JB051]
MTKLPGVVVNHDQKFVDVTAKVVLRDGDWLELLLCTPGTREHESILTTTAKPSHIHLALVMLGLEPGHPMTGQKVGDKLEVTAASGPLVAIDLHYTLEDKAITVPANQWVYDKNTKQDLPDNQWLFAGSSFIKTNDQRLYRADINGSVITLVHFGDDLLARKTNLTSRNDNARWQARTEKIPPVGTPLIIRLKPVPPPASTDQKTDKTRNTQ